MLQVRLTVYSIIKAKYTVVIIANLPSTINPIVSMTECPQLIQFSSLTSQHDCTI